MGSFQSKTVAEQVADHLLHQFQEGRWGHEIPGVMRLARELGVNHKSVETALHLMERDGYLKSNGAGRRREITSKVGRAAGLKIAVLLWDVSDRALNYVIELQHRLREAGHIVIEPRQTLLGMKLDVKRVAALVQSTKADAWVVMIGSREVLEWFSTQGIPTYAIFGGYWNLPVAATGVSKNGPIAEATRKLVQLGHRRIVMILRHQHRLPHPSPTVSTFIATLKEAGIQTSSYNLPEWEETSEGFQNCLESLFKVTPPTALVLDEALFYNASCHFLLSKGLRVPRDVSLISLDEDPDFQWVVPSIAFIRKCEEPMIKHIMRWAEHISRGKPYCHQQVIESEYVPGNSVGPAPTA